MTRLTRAAALPVVALSLAACAGPAPVWSKPDAKGNEFQEAKYACLKDATALGGSMYVGFGMTERVPNAALFHECMGAHGWRNVAGQVRPAVDGWK